MSEKIFGEIQNTEELNELAVNLRKNKEFDEIRLLCSENNISGEVAEEFIQGKRLHLALPEQQKNSNPLQSTTWETVRASMKVQRKEEHPSEEKPAENSKLETGETEKNEDQAKAEPEYTVDDVRKKLVAELKIYRDGDSKYVVEKLIEKCETDKDLLKAIMLPHKSYDKAFQYFYKKSRTVGYKMPHGNMVYLDNDSALKLSVEYFKRDDAAEDKKNPPKKATEKPKNKCVEAPKKQETPKRQEAPAKPKETQKVPEKPKQEQKAKKNEMAGQMSLFDL